MVSKCPRTNRAKLLAIREQLKKYGDIPKKEVMKATRPTTAKQWECICDSKGKVLSAGRVEKTDWYLWTTKNLFTTPEARNKGLANRVVKKLHMKAIKQGAHVIKGDITSSNLPSKLTNQKLGMKTVATFKYSNKKPPADIVMKVVDAPSKKEIQKINERLKNQMKAKGKIAPKSILAKKI